VSQTKGLVYLRDKNRPPREEERDLPRIEKDEVLKGGTAIKNAVRTKKQSLNLDRLTKGMKTADRITEEKSTTTPPGSECYPATRRKTSSALAGHGETGKAATRKSEDGISEKRS